MLLFNAFGTFGLEVFTWIVSILVGAVAALIFFDVLKTSGYNEEENHSEE